MARLNIEEKWWTDPRRIKLARLLGSFGRADGAAIELWRMSQEHWKRECTLIPLKLFNQVEFPKELLECCLAEIRGEEVYVSGTKEYHTWLLGRQDAGRKGGLANAKQKLANASKLKPPTPTLPPSLKLNPKSTENSFQVEEEEDKEFQQAKLEFYKTYPDSQVRAEKIQDLGQGIDHIFPVGSPSHENLAIATWMNKRGGSYDE